MFSSAPTRFWLSAATALFLFGAAGADEAPSARSSAERSVFCTFKGPAGGGVVEYRIDKASGRIVDESVIAQDRAFFRPHKLALTEDGRYLLATSQHAALKNLLLADLASGESRFLSVDRKPDDLDAWSDRFVIGADSHMCYIVDAGAGKVAHSWFGRHQTSPAGRRIEYVRTTPDGTAWTSWQKDSPGGRLKGSRVVAIDAATGKTLADLRMPRSMDHLNLADRKERGPNPEIILPSPRTNTLLLSMDLYGGVAMADLDAAREGRWQSLSYHSVAPDSTWGGAFPDRAVLVESGGKDFALVANAGLAGGVSWIDLAERRILQRIEAPPGIAAPVAVAGGRIIAGPIPGKAKRRSFGELRETRLPSAELAVFEVSGPASAPRLNLRTVALPAPASAIAAVDPDSKDLVFLVATDEVLVAKASSGDIVDRRPLDGGRQIQRIASR